MNEPRDESDAEDPVERAFRLAPIADEPMTDEERAAMAVVPERWIPHEEVMATIRKMAEDEGAGEEFDEIVRERARLATSSGRTGSG